jgi:hypothetical protein
MGQIGSKVATTIGGSEYGVANRIVVVDYHVCLTEWNAWKEVDTGAG